MNSTSSLRKTLTLYFNLHFQACRYNFSPAASFTLKKPCTMRTFIFLVAGVCLSAGIAFAQEPETLSRTIFKLSPQHFTQNSLKGGVERFNKNHSLSVAVFITGRMEKNEDSHYRDGYDGLAGELQVRKYISPMKAVT